MAKIKGKTFKECMMLLTKELPLSSILTTQNGVHTWYIKCNDKEAYRFSNTRFNDDKNPPRELQNFDYAISCVLGENTKETVNPHFINSNDSDISIMEFVWPISEKVEWDAMLNSLINYIREKRKKYEEDKTNKPR